MKKLISITFCLLFLGLTNLFSQTVNDVPIKDIDVKYIQIIGTSRFLSNRVTIEIDFGQENRLISLSRNMQIKDEDGRPLEFNSMIDALNFFADNGYEFVNAYVITVGNQNVYHYMLKKKDE